LVAGDSGGPNFYLVGGTMPAIVGLNWFAYNTGSGSSFVPDYLAELQQNMNESLSIVTDPAGVEKSITTSTCSPTSA
jgi:hypothetical protein